MSTAFSKALMCSVLPLIASVVAGCGGGGGGGNQGNTGGNTTGSDASTLRCGGSSVSVSPANPAAVPGAPQNLTATGGDQTINVSWNPPAADGGSPVQAYFVCITAGSNNSNLNQTTGTSLVVNNNIANGTTYTVTVTARNANGFGPASQAVSVSASAVSPGGYTPLIIQGDDSPSGIFDPSVISMSGGPVWMAYSSVNYHSDANTRLVQDVGIRLARSDDSGKTFRFASTIAAPEPAVVTDTDPRLSACGASTCSGRWVYETAWLADDVSDPDSARRFKLFAHKYFLYPPGAAPTLYHLGAIVMWTAATPDGKWSGPQTVLGWNLTPPELQAPNLVNALHSDLASCIASAEGGVSVRGDTLDFVLTCVYPGANPLPQKIVLLRSTDHARTFQYVSTLLTPDDGTAFGAKFFTAPSILPTGDAAPVLIATPAVGVGLYAGCAVFAFADMSAGTLARTDNAPIRILSIPPLAGHFGGACAWDRGLTNTGILLNDVVPGATQADARFRILATGHGL